MTTCLCLLYLLFVHSVAAVGNHSKSSIYAGLSIDLSHFFNSVCINFLTDPPPEREMFVSKVLKDVASSPSGKISNALSFDNYYYRTKDKKLQCHSPLQIVVSYDEATRIAFMRHSQRSSMHGSDSPGGGVWLVFLTSVKEEFAKEYFKGINTPFDVQLVIAELNRNDEMVLKEVFRVLPEKPLRLQNMGTWSKNKGLQLINSDYLHYSRRSNLEGINLNVGYVLSDPFTMIEQENGQPRLTGYLGDVWEILEKALNVSTTLILEPNYGTFLEKTQKWTGLVNHVKNNDFDVGIADLTLTIRRSEVISFSNPLSITSFNVFYQIMGSNVETGALFLPLATDLWLSLAGWIIVASLILYIGCYLSDKKLFTHENMSLMNALFFVGGALCGQSGVNIPKTYTCRVFFIATFFITAVIIPAYSASLMSILTISTPNVPFSSMKEFYENGKTRMMLKYSSYEYEIFSADSSNEPFMNKIFKRDIESLPESEFPTTIMKAIRTICQNPGFAVFGLVDSIKWAIFKEENREGQNRKCRITSMPLNFGQISLGMALPKNSHIRGLINHHLSYLPTTGILQRLQLKHWPQSKPLSIIEEHQPVGLENVSMMFAAFGFGIALSLIFLLIEIMLASQLKNKPQRESKESWASRVRRHGLINDFYVK